MAPIQLRPVLLILRAQELHRPITVMAYNCKPQGRRFRGNIRTKRGEGLRPFSQNILQTETRDSGRAQSLNRAVVDALLELIGKWKPEAGTGPAAVRSE